MALLSPAAVNYPRLTPYSKAWGMDSTWPIFAGLFVGLILCGFRVGNHSFRDFTSGTAMSCPDDGISQHSFPSFSSYSPTPLW